MEAGMSGTNAKVGNLSGELEALFIKLQYQYLHFKDVIIYIIIIFFFLLQTNQVLTWKTELVTISTSAFTQTSPRAPALSHTG